MVWPDKFKPELPPRYDGSANPTEVLLLYTISIQAAKGDDRVMANWFPMALKDAARSWLMNLPEASISLWEDLCKQFVANFTGTSDRPLTLNDLRAVHQRPGEPLRKFIQRFSQVRNRIPKASDAAIVSAFTNGVADVKMCEKLSVRDELDSVAELFVLADRCAKAEEGRLFLHNDPDDERGAAKPKGKDTKRKGPTVLAVEPDYKRGRDRGEAKKDDHPFCAYHNVNSHSTEDCHELKLLHEGCTECRGSRKERGKGRGGGGGGGRWGDNNNYGAGDNNRQGWQNQPRQANLARNAEVVNTRPPAHRGPTRDRGGCSGTKHMEHPPSP